MTTLTFPDFGEAGWNVELVAAILAAQASGDQTSVTAANWTGTVSAAALEFPGTHRRAITGNTTISALPAPASTISGSLTFELIQSSSGTGTYTVTWPSAVKWGYGKNAPVVPTRLGGYIIVHLFWDGTQWSGVVQDEY